MAGISGGHPRREGIYDCFISRGRILRTVERAVGKETQAAGDGVPDIGSHSADPRERALPDDEQPCDRRDAGCMEMGHHDGSDDGICRHGNKLCGSRLHHEGADFGQKVRARQRKAGLMPRINIHDLWLQ